MAASKPVSKPAVEKEAAAPPVDVSALADEFERLKAEGRVQTPRFVELKKILNGG